VFGEAGFMQYDLKEIQEQTCPEFAQWSSSWLVTKKPLNERLFCFLNLWITYSAFHKVSNIICCVPAMASLSITTTTG
jgi:hypothetical protein